MRASSGLGEGGSFFLLSSYVPIRIIDGLYDFDSILGLLFPRGPGVKTKDLTLKN